MSTVCDSSIVFSPASEAGRTIEEDIADLNGSGVVLFALFGCHEGPLIPLTHFTDVDTAVSPEHSSASFSPRSIRAEIQSANERHSGGEPERYESLQPLINISDDCSPPN